MSETNVHYANLAQALGKSVTASDALRSTTICVIETDTGGVFVGYVTDLDVTDDGARQAAAYAVTSQLVPADEPPETEEHVAEGLADHPDAVVETTPEPVAEAAPEPAPESAPVVEAAPEPAPVAGTVAAPETLDTVAGAAGADSVTADAGAGATPTPKGK